MRRLSSDATGKDGDVISATIAHDGVAVVCVKEEDMPVLAAARSMIEIRCFGCGVEIGYLGHYGCNECREAKAILGKFE